jgi:hypothetical protein
VQLLITDLRGYPFVGERAWFIDEQSPVDVGHQILLVNSKVAQMPSMTLGCSFTRLLNKGAAAKPENQSAQKNCQSQKRCAFSTPDDTQNRPNESVFHCFFLLKFNNRGLLSSRGYLTITQSTNAITSEAKNHYISRWWGLSMQKADQLWRLWSRCMKESFYACKLGFFRTI